MSLNAAEPQKLRGPFVVPRDIWNPERFLVPTNAPRERLPQWELDQGAYSRLRLSFMIAAIRLDFPDEIPATPEPVPITPEEVHVLMGKLCSKLNNCRR